ncbi:XRE family transcriptional regulator [Streptomyces sp. NPDC003660]
MRRRKLLAGLAGATAGAVLGPTAEAHPLAQDPTLSAVSAAVDASRADFSACRYDALARLLPGRIALAQALGDPVRAASAVAELYTIATRLCIKLGEDGMAAVTADRALTAALGGADALTVAEAHRMVSSAWRRQGHYARATDVAVTAAQQLTTDRSTDRTDRLSVQGNLYATAAYTAAKQGDRHSAQALIAEAEATAGQLGRDALLRGTVFGPSQVLLHQVSVSHLLGDAGQAIEHARRIDPAALPTAERRARYWIDVARAFDQWGKPDRCYRALLAAEQAAPQEVRRGSVQSMAADLLRHDRALPGVRAFAQRAGAVA